MPFCTRYTRIYHHHTYPPCILGGQRQGKVAEESAGRAWRDAAGTSETVIMQVSKELAHGQLLPRAAAEWACSIS